MSSIFTIHWQWLLAMVLMGLATYSTRLSGLLLMGALRGVLTPGAGGWALACLAASGVCHALDLRQRWRRAPR